MIRPVLSTTSATMPASTYTYGKFVWFEHMSPDMDKAKRFYNALFGWSTQAVAMGDGTYPMVMNGNNGIGGYRQAVGAAPTHWVCFISVPDVDASFKAIQRMECRTLQTPVDYGPGRMAAAADPTGAPFAMWHGAEGDRTDAPAETGDWHWTELWTGNPKKAIEFYRTIFGYGVDTMDMPDGAYHLFTMGGTPRAGMMEAMGPKGKPMWLPYVAVADCDATLEKGKGLGAVVLSSPQDIEGVGRFAVLVDPLGAAIGIIKPA